MDRQVASLARMNGEHRVGGYGITLAFYKVVPGLESELVAAERSKRAVLPRPYWTVGRSDVLIIEPFHDVTEFVSPLFPRGSTHIHSVPCFLWEEPRATLLEETLQEPVLGVCFAKLRSDLVGCHGIAAEQRALRFVGRDLAHSHPNVKRTPLGSLGWTEIILLLGGSDIQSIFNAVAHIRRVTDADVFPETLPDGQKPATPPIFLTTFTVPAVNFRAIERRDGVHRVSANVGKAVARMTVSCIPGSERRLTRLLASSGFSPEHFNTTFMLGKGDLVVEAKDEVEFGAFVASLLNFRGKIRRRLGVTVFGTESIVSTERLPRRPARGYRRPEPTQRLERPRPGLLLEPFRRPGSIYHHVGLYSSLGTMIQLDASCKNNALLYGAFLDMKRFVPRIREDIERSTEGYDTTVSRNVFTRMTANLLVQKLRNAVELYAFGFSERRIGMYETVYESIDPPKAYPGGVHRILQAAATIPHRLCEPFRHSWPGFIVFGRGPWCQREEYGVMSVPLSELLRPEGWWQLFHEVGHEIAESVNLAGLDQIVTLIETQLGPRSEESFHRMREFVTEVFADLFDYHYGFGRNFDLYSETVWDFLDAYLQQTLTSPRRFVLRHVFVKLLHDGKDLARYERREVRKAVGDLKARLANMNLATDIAEVDDEEIADAAMALRPAMPTVLEHLRIDTEPRAVPDASTETARQLAAVAEGNVEPIRDPDSFDPISFLVGLADTVPTARKREEAFRRSVAAILSLWSWYHIKLTSIGISPSSRRAAP